MITAVGAGSAAHVERRSHEPQFDSLTASRVEESRQIALTNLAVAQKRRVELAIATYSALQAPQQAASLARAQQAYGEF